MIMNATYFDGHTSRRHDVTVDLREGRWLVTGAHVERSEHHDSVQVSSRLGGTPRLLRFADGASCEVADGPALSALLDAAGLEPDRIGRAATGVVWLAPATAVAFVTLLVVGYVFGLPLLARGIAARAPAVAVRRLGDNTLGTLDRLAFKPSEVSAGARAAMMAAKDRLALADGLSGRSLRVDLRKAPSIGPNAFTLPDGRIIVTDELVALARTDDELMGVIAHEAGHAHHKHALRLVLESSTLSLLLSWYVGDVNALAVTAPGSLLRAKYSRDFEREADDYAIQTLRQSGRSPSALADILERMAAQHAGAATPAYLSSHPATAERVARFRAAK